MKYIEIDYSLDPCEISQSGSEENFEAIAKKIGLDDCGWVTECKADNGGEYELCTDEYIAEYRQLFPEISVNAEAIDGDGFVLFFWEE